MRYAVCGRCNGNGYTEKVVRGNCPKCHGTGRYDRKTCTRCGGNGITTYIDKMRCSNCRGTGKIVY